MFSRLFSLVLVVGLTFVCVVPRLVGQTVTGDILYLTLKVNGAAGSEYDPGDTLRVEFDAEGSNDSGQAVYFKMTVKVTEASPPFTEQASFTHSALVQDGNDYSMEAAYLSWTSLDQADGYNVQATLITYVDPKFPSPLDALTDSFTENE